MVAARWTWQNHDGSVGITVEIVDCQSFGVGQKTIVQAKVSHGTTPVGICHPIGFANVVNGSVHNIDRGGQCPSIVDNGRAVKPQNQTQTAESNANMVPSAMSDLLNKAVIEFCAGLICGKNQTYAWSRSTNKNIIRRNTIAKIKQPLRVLRHPCLDEVPLADGEGGGQIDGGQLKVLTATLCKEGTRYIGTGTSSLIGG